MHKANRVFSTPAAIGVICLAIAGCATTSIHAVGHQRLADPGDKEEVSLVIAVTKGGDPVTGLGMGNFDTRANPVPPGGCFVTITRVVSGLPGVYLLDIVPFTDNPACVWKKGRYVIGISVSAGSSSGAAVTELVID